MSTCKNIEMVVVTHGDKATWRAYFMLDTPVQWLRHHFCEMPLYKSDFTNDMTDARISSLCFCIVAADKS